MYQNVKVFNIINDHENFESELKLNKDNIEYLKFIDDYSNKYQKIILMKILIM